MTDEVLAGCPHSYPPTQLGFGPEAGLPLVPQSALDKNEARSGREETTISIRNDKRSKELQKKRFGAGGTGIPMIPGENPSQSVGSQAWAESDPGKLVEGVHSDDPNQQLPEASH